IQAKSLGQVVSGYNHSQRASTTSTASRGGRTTSIASTTARGVRFSAAARSASRVSSARITNGRGFAGSSHAIGSRVAMGGGFSHAGMGGGFGHGGMGGAGFGGHGGGGGRGK